LNGNFSTILEDRELHILGNSAAVPTRDRSPTAQLIELGKYRFLIDCGEGTQYQLIKLGLKFSRIQAIFISHLHGDHFLGLFGLLNTMSLGGRIIPLRIFSPPGLKDLFDNHSSITGSVPDYQIEWQELTKDSEVLVDEKDLLVSARLAEHRVPCYSFRFDHGNRLRKLNIDKCNEQGIPVDWYERLKLGEDYRAGKKSIPNEDLTTAPKPTIAYTFITDSLYSEKLISFAKDSNWLYHEATFLNEEADKAHQTFHSTAAEAGQFASLAGVKNLILGHFSSRYMFLNDHKTEAEKYFKPVFIGRESEKFIL
jgi:ribonuclease Z